VKRELRPRATEGLTVAVVTVTDLTAAIVLGFEPRPFREFLVRERVPHARVGRHVVARIEHVLVALDRLAARREEPAVAATSEADDEPTADKILARIGRVRGAR
jgi:hypothetical protein